MQLSESGVVFYENGTTINGVWTRYVLDGKPMRGITSMIKNQLFPTKYSNVSKEVLDRAKDRGTLVHNLCRLADGLGVSSNILSDDYFRMTRERGMVVEDSEYIVTDRENFASAIDKVFRVDENTFDLGDIKTVSKWDEEEKAYVSWQLSIYAYFFEMQNPGCKVRNLYGIWLPNPEKKYGKPTIEEVIRIPSVYVMELLRCEINGETFENPSSLTSTSSTDIIPERYAVLESSMRELERRMTYYSDMYKQIKDELLQAMIDNDVCSWKSDSMVITRKKSFDRITMDVKKILEDFPEIDKSKYEKHSTVGDSITIKFK